MMRHRVNHLRRAVVDIELFASLALLMFLATLVAEGLFRYTRTRDEQLFRRALIAAADAQMQRYDAGAPIDSPPPAGVLPVEIELETRALPAGDGWPGFTRVTVVATARLPHGKVVHEEVTGLVRGEGAP